MELGNAIWGHSRGEYEIERFPAQDYFGEFFEAAGLDAFGWCNENSVLYKYMDDKGMINTELFSIFPYYWGENEELESLPNFTYKPEGIEIRWYKYPLRDSYSNVELSTEKMQQIIDACRRFVEILKEAKK